MNSALFFEELMKQMEASEIQDDSKICLISHEPLDDTAVTLSCNHSFNYPEILSEVIRQKKQYNPKETQRLHYKEIKCPYCRKITSGLLPPREGFDDINGVNYPFSLCFTCNKCIAEFKSGKKKGEQCKAQCKGSYCKLHLRTQKSQSSVSNSESNENIVINSVKCKAVLETGKNKGKQCSRFKKFGDYCGTHNKKYGENN